MRIVVQSPKDGSYRQYDGVDKSVHSRDLTEIGVCPEDTLRLISMMYVFPAEGEALAATKQIENAVFDLYVMHIVVCFAYTLASGDILPLVVTTWMALALFMAKTTSSFQLLIIRTAILLALSTVVML